MTDGKKPKAPAKPRRGKKTPVAGAPTETSSTDSAPVPDPDASAPTTADSGPAPNPVTTRSDTPVIAASMPEPVERPDSAPDPRAASMPESVEQPGQADTPSNTAASMPAPVAPPASAPTPRPASTPGPAERLGGAPAPTVATPPAPAVATPLTPTVASAPAPAVVPAPATAPAPAVVPAPATAPAPAVVRSTRTGTERGTDAELGPEPNPMLSGPSPDWPLDTSEADNAQPAPPPPPEPPVMRMPDPKAAALEAARIVGEIVGDIESAGGAAIVAAAAAGAAIEAARARSVYAAENPEAAAAAAAHDAAHPPPPDPPGGDPVTTVRMQRDRILRALAEDIAAQAEAQANPQPAAERPATETPDKPPEKRAGSVPERAPSVPGARAPSVPGRAATAPGARTSSQAEGVDEGDDELDPVQIAAAAIQRLRRRARTDLAELRTQYHRHDIFVLLLALVIIVVAGRAHQRMITPPTVKFAERGLVFEHSKAWLAPEQIPAPTPRIVHELTGQPSNNPALFHVEFTSSIDPNAKIEVWIDKKPAWSNIVTGLELDRRTRWGELYTLDDSSVRPIAGHDWLRTVYRYAHATEKGDVPRVDRAIEYATIDREQIYVITLFGNPAELERIEEVIAPTLRVPTQTGLPLVPQTRTLAQRTYPNAVARAFDSTVMIVAADLIDGRLKPRGGGSGVIVGGDGSILTNYHVIHDKDGRLHDVFVIGRFSQPDHAPQLWCAGRPNRSKLQRELDLALIKCDLDLDGRAWLPTSTGVWPTLPEARTADVRMGQRLWVLGYPDVGGGGLTLSEGDVEGWTGEDGTAGKDFIKTDGSITHGNSGGPVVDDHGRLVGIASAFRIKVSASGSITETAQVGLVRPLSTASDLLAIAAAGWTPREGHTDVELQPSAVEAPAEGVRISTKVIDAANEAPVRDALVMILRPDVKSSAVDVNRLDDQVLSWGRTNTQGEVQLKQPVPVPGTYSVMVVARGYEPLIGEGELHLDANTPPDFDPWGKIWLRSR